MIHRHCKSFVDFPPSALSAGAVCHYVCVLWHKNTRQWFLILESSRLIRECGFRGAVIERKLKEIKEIKAADTVQKIKHWGELKQAGRNERTRQRAANMCGCARTHEWLLWAILSFYSCTATTCHTLQQIQKETWPSIQGCQTILAKK